MKQKFGKDVLYHKIAFSANDASASVRQLARNFQVQSLLKSTISGCCC